MINTILGQKIDQSQSFLSDDRRIPVTKVSVLDNPVVMVKTKDKNGYSSIQLGFGIRKKSNKSLLGQARGANLKSAPRFFREVRADEQELPKVGDYVKALDVLKPGDIVDVKGVSKGKGYAGVVKRHHFKGGPRTHGQSDRERAPGSIGQTTTPGRVYKGKRMAGRMGHENVTIKNLEVLDVLENLVLIKGLIPGAKNSLVVIKKVGENKKFVPLYEAESNERQSHVSDDARQPEEETPKESPSSLSEHRPPKLDSEPKDEVESAFSSSESGQPLIVNTKDIKKEEVKEEKTENAS